LHAFGAIGRIDVTVRDATVAALQLRESFHVLKGVGVELQGVRKPTCNGRGRLTISPLFEAEVVLLTDASERGDFVPPEASDSSHIGAGEPNILRLDECASRAQILTKGRLDAQHEVAFLDRVISGPGGVARAARDDRP
jgi:hypothetical protein